MVIFIPNYLEWSCGWVLQVWLVSIWEGTPNESCDGLGHFLSGLSESRQLSSRKKKLAPGPLQALKQFLWRHKPFWSSGGRINQEIFYN